jgi:RNA polymerase sigma factor (sigma-70 family)
MTNHSMRTSITGRNQLRRCRERAGLTQSRLAQLSGVGRRFINAVEQHQFNPLIDRRYLPPTVEGEHGLQRLMRETLLRWAAQLHALAQAVEVEFDEVFPSEYTTALCDQLWLRLSLSQQRSAIGDNPWHDWGWFSDGPLSEQLVDDEADQQLEQFDLEEVVQTNLVVLPRREQRILTGLYGLGGAPTCTVEELSQQLGLTVERVQQLERHALSRLRRHGRRLVEYWR